MKRLETHNKHLSFTSRAEENTGNVIAVMRLPVTIAMK